MAVLQIQHRWGPEAGCLAVLTLPDKTRHGEITEIQVATPVVFSDKSDLLQNCINYTSCDHYATLIVE